MSTKFTKKELKTPDQVLKTLEDGFQWSQTHSTLLMSAIAIFIVGGIGLSIFGAMSEKKESGAQEAYAQYEKTYLDKKRGFEEAERQTLKPNPATDPKAPAKVKATGDMDKDYSAEVAGFNKVLEEHPSTKAAQMSALTLSEIFLAYKKPDDALQALQKVEKKSQGKDLISYVVLTQFGNVLSEKNDCPAAVGQWDKVIARKEATFLHDTLRLKSAFCYEKMNDLAKAEELYKKISANAQAPADPTTGMGEAGLGKEADKYLRLLKLKKGPAEAQGT